MTTTINISLNIPPTYHVEDLTRQLTEYAERLIASRTHPTKAVKHYRHESLRGLMKGVNASSEELVDEYLEEKYGV